MLRVLKVTGESLTPSYLEGDFVITTNIPLLLSALKAGDIVVLRHAVYGTLIKRVDRIDPIQDEIFVTGTHDLSLDSRQFGSVHKKDLLGKVIGHIKKPRRQA